MRSVVIAAAFACAAFGQTSRTYSPQVDQVSYTVWNVVACGAQDLPAGTIYQEMVAHGVAPLFNVQALDLISQVQAKSFWAKAYTYGTYAVAGLAAAMNLAVIKANPSYVKTGNVASGVLNTLIPMAQKKVTNAPPAWLSMLVRDHDLIRVGTNDCQTAVVLGGRGKAFTVAGGR